VSSSGNKKEDAMSKQGLTTLLGVGFVLVTLAVFAVSAVASAPPDHPTVFVGVCGSPSYPTIQAAVDAANAGWTITVCKGTHTENVNVNDAVKLYDGLRIEAGDGSKLSCPTPLTGSGFDLHANHVEILGFDITGCASAISVEAGYGGELFQNNSLHGNVVGISFNSSSGNNSVINNEIFDNTGNGIFDYEPLGDYFFSNGVHNNGGNGIEISSGSCVVSCAYIVGNRATQNGSNGVYLNNASNVEVKWNRLTRNGNNGLDANTSTGDEIVANEADRNGSNGIQTHSTSTGINLTDNRMTKNKNVDAMDNDANTWTNNHCTTTGGSATCVP
jgi:hypothetical protein